MDWFHPTAPSITDLSFTCINLVFLGYLLTLKDKSRNCYIMIVVYACSILQSSISFIAESQYTSPFYVMAILFLGRMMAPLSILWGSYRFGSNPYPREFRTVISIFLLAFAFCGWHYLQDYWQIQRINTVHFLMLILVCAAASLLGAINYLRKMKRARRNNVSKEVTIFRILSINLFAYTLIWLMVIAFAEITVNPYLFYFSVYPLVVMINTWSALAYFDFASEKTSFITKLVGMTNTITLTILSLIPIILFGFSAETEKYIKIFVWIVPGISLLITLVVPLVFRNTLLKHLSQVLSGVQLVTSGDLSARVDTQVNDEIGRLADNFNIMIESLQQRTEQLSNMRETMATDFHDQTGNMLSAITRQASLLKLKLRAEDDTQPMVESIINNSNALYAGSKDFLWHLNHNSDEAEELFTYLTAYGQRYYNQFEMAFSSAAEDCHGLKLEPSAALHLIFILKEAMTNVVKHAGADEVKLSMRKLSEQIVYSLEDNGSWKPADTSREHYGLKNMERRCAKNSLKFALQTDDHGTSITISAPAYHLIPSNS